MLKRVFVLAGTFGTMMALAAVGCSSSSTDLIGGGDSGSEGDGSGLGGDGGKKTDGGPLGSDGGGDSGTIKRDGGLLTGGDSGTVTNPVDAGTVASLDAGHPADGGKDGGGAILADGGTLACFMSDDAQYDNSTGPVAHQNKCTTTQITTFDSSCFGSGSSTAACNALLSADAACGTCIFGGAGSPSAVVLPLGDQDEVNQAACYAAISATATTDCKFRYENVNYCTQTTCATCSDANSADECFNYSEVDPGSICSQNFGTDGTCIDSVEGSLLIVDAQTKCGYNATTFDTAFVAVATTFCGP